MDEAPHHELRALQRRAYGRRPDLDPGEWARLRELETAAAAPRAEAAPPEAPSPVGDRPAELPAPPVGVSSPQDPVPRRTRRLPLLWAASLVAAALLGAGATTWAAGSDDREVATLRLSPAEDLPGWGGSEDTLASDVFHGLRMVKRPSGEDGGSCLYVVPADAGAAGIVYSGCSARSFPATAQLTVSPSLPAELRDEFGDGSGLRFVLEGETVHVSSDR